MVRVCVVLLTILGTMTLVIGRETADRVNARFDKIEAALERIEADLVTLKIDDAVTKQTLRDLRASR